MRLALLLLVVILYSCSSTRNLDVVTLKKGTLLTNHSDLVPDDTKVDHQIKIWQVEKYSYAKLNLDKEKIEIEIFDPSKSLKLIDSISVTEDLGTPKKQSLQLLNKNAFVFSPKIKPWRLKNYFLNREYINFKETTIAGSDQFKKSGTLHYGKHKWLFQTLTIPFKLRKSEGEVPSQVTTSFNAGIAFGRQWNINKVRPIYSTEDFKMKGYDENKFSFSLAPFLGLTPVSLTSDNTNGDILTNQSVLGLSTGLAGVVSINSFNVGLAFGADFGLNNSENWIYQGELWTGIVLGISIFK